MMNSSAKLMSFSLSHVILLSAQTLFIVRKKKSVTAQEISTGVEHSEMEVGLSTAEARPLTTELGLSIPVSSEMETRISEPEVSELQAELDHLQNKVEYLKLANEALEKTYPTWNNLRHNEASVIFYTCLPSSDVFEALFTLLANVNIEYYYQWNVMKITKEDQLLMTLMKLRLNLPRYDLSQWFRCSEATV